MVLSTLSSDPLETVADAVRHEAGRGPLWFQLYFYLVRCSFFLNSFYIKQFL